MSEPMTPEREAELRERRNWASYNMQDAAEMWAELDRLRSRLADAERERDELASHINGLVADLGERGVAVAELAGALRPFAEMAKQFHETGRMRQPKLQVYDNAAAVLAQHGGGE